MSTLRPGLDDGSDNWSNPDTSCDQRYPDCYISMIGDVIPAGEAINELKSNGYIVSVIERKHLASILTGKIYRPWGEPGDEPSLSECLADAISRGLYPPEPFGKRYSGTVINTVAVKFTMMPWNTNFHYNKSSTYGGYYHCEDDTYWCGVTWDAYYKNGWNYYISYVGDYYEFDKCTSNCYDEEYEGYYGECVPLPEWEWDPNKPNPDDPDNPGGYIPIIPGDPNIPLDPPGILPDPTDPVNPGDAINCIKTASCDLPVMIELVPDDTNDILPPGYDENFDTVDDSEVVIGKCTTLTEECIYVLDCDVNGYFVAESGEEILYRYSNVTGSLDNDQIITSLYSVAEEMFIEIDTNNKYNNEDTIVVDIEGADSTFTASWSVDGVNYVGDMPPTVEPYIVDLASSGDYVRICITALGEQ